MKKDKPQITIKNIKSFIEGNTKMFLADLGLQPEHLKEQVAYRTILCEECLIINECKECHCKLPEKFYVKESCNNGEIFPDLMNKSDWENFKKENDIQ